MGWLETFAGVESINEGVAEHHDKHHHHSHDRDRRHNSSSMFGLGESSSHHDRKRHNSSSFFGMSNGSHSHDKNRSSSSFFGGGGHHNSSKSSFFGGRSSSYYKRSSRPGFMNQAYRKLRRLWRDLVRHMKRNPIKVFMLVIMPLITGGALTGLLAKFGVRLPRGMQGLFGGGGKNRSGSGIGGSSNAHGARHTDYEYSKTKAEGPLGSLGGMGGAMGGAMTLAKMFM